MERLFITGIDTNVGKTIVSAILVEALGADYWKPVQAGELHHTDTMKVRELVSNKTSVFHQEVYRLRTPMSPHIAASRDGITIELNKITAPATNNTLVIEGAGGLLVPLDDKGTVVADMIKQLQAHVVLVSRNYLGSINHTLLTARVLKQYGIPVKGIVFNGEEMDGTEAIIQRHTGYNILGRIEEEERIDVNMVSSYAAVFKANKFLDIL